MPTFDSQEEVDLQNSLTAPITVPAGTDWVVIQGSHYDGAAGTTLQSADINGDNFTISSQLAEGTPEDATGLFSAFLYGPAIGAQTLTIAWSAGGNRDDGGQVSVIYGTDTGGNATEVRDADTAHDSFADQSVTVDTETGVDDVLLGHVAAYTANVTIDAPATPTLITSNPIEDDVASVLSRGYTLTPAATSTQVDQDTNSFGGITVICLREAVAAGQTIPVGQVAETDASQVLASAKQRAIGLVTEADLAQAIVLQVSASLTITGITGGADLSNLEYMVLDSQDLSIANILAAGTGEDTDANGDLIIDLNGTGAVNGQLVWYIIKDTTETNAAQGPGTVVVS